MTKLNPVESSFVNCGSVSTVFTTKKPRQSDSDEKIAHGFNGPKASALQPELGDFRLVARHPLTHDRPVAGYKVGPKNRRITSCPIICGHL